MVSASSQLRILSRSALLLVAAFAIACGHTPTTPGVPTLSISKILAFGDSLTEGDATPFDFHPFSPHPTPDAGNPKGYPYRLLGLLTQRYPSQNILVFNGGWGGRNASDDALEINRSLTEFLDAFSPEVMILMHGANDLNQQSPDVPTIASFVGQLVDKAKARGVSVIVSSLPPRLSGGTPDRGNHPELVVPFNNALSTMAAQKGARYIDIYGSITQNLAGPDMAPDGLHLTQAGNDKLAAAYFAFLKSTYETIK